MPMTAAGRNQDFQLWLYKFVDNNSRELLLKLLDLSPFSQTPSESSGLTAGSYLMTSHPVSWAVTAQTETVQSAEWTDL